MGVLAGEREPGSEVDLTSSEERVVGPEHDPLVPRGAGEPDAFIYEACTESQPASDGINEQDPKLRRRAVCRHAKDAADALAARLCNPGGFPNGVVGGRVVGHDAGDEGFEGVVPAELGCIDLAMSHDHPPQVAWFTEWSNFDGAISHAPIVAPSGIESVRVHRRRTPWCAPCERIRPRCRPWTEEWSGDRGREALSDGVSGGVDEAWVVVEVDLTFRLQPQFRLRRRHRGVEVAGERWGEGVL